jgi:uncharacterized protein (TIGR03000 family)
LSSQGLAQYGHKGGVRGWSGGHSSTGLYHGHGVHRHGYGGWGYGGWGYGGWGYGGGGYGGLVYAGRGNGGPVYAGYWGGYPLIYNIESNTSPLYVSYYDYYTNDYYPLDYYTLDYLDALASYSGVMPASYNRVTPSYSSGVAPATYNSFVRYTPVGMPDTGSAVKFAADYAAGTSWTATGDNTAIVAVRVPADSQVWFGDTKTTQSGTERQFVTPALAPGKSYKYDVKVTWMVDGKEVTQTRQVQVEAGKMAVATFKQ